MTSIERLIATGWTHAMVPTKVTILAALSDRGFRMYCYLSARVNRDGACWPTIETMANDLTWKTRKVDAALSDLVKAGLIHSTQRPGTSTMRTLLVRVEHPEPAEEAPEEEPAPEQEALREKAHGLDVVEHVQTIGINNEGQGMTGDSEKIESPGDVPSPEPVNLPKPDPVTPLSQKIPAVLAKLEATRNKQALIAWWAEHLSGERVHPAAVAKLAKKLFEGWDGWERPTKPQIYEKLVRWAAQTAIESPPEGKYFNYLWRHAEEEAGIAHVPQADRDRHKELQRKIDSGEIKIPAVPDFLVGMPGVPHVTA